MLKHAVNLARAGRAVYVIADNKRDAERLTNLLHEMIPPGVHGPRILGIKVETPDTIGDFNWDSMRTPTAHPNCVFLVDHHAIEDRYAKLLEMLHAYDKP